MKLVPTTLVLLLTAALAASAHAHPVGSSVMTFEERFAIRGCEPYRGRGLLAITVRPDGAFELATEAGVFQGFVRPAEGRSRSWRLRFDDASLSLYALYLRAGANALCDTDASLSGGEIQTALLRLGRNGRVSLTLRASAEGSSASGAWRGRHRLVGTGMLRPPEPAPVAPERPVRLQASTQWVPR